MTPECRPAEYKHTDIIGICKSISFMGPCEASFMGYHLKHVEAQNNCKMKCLCCEICISGAWNVLYSVAVSLPKRLPFIFWNFILRRIHLFQIAYSLVGSNCLLTFEGWQLLLASCVQLSPTLLNVFQFLKEMYCFWPLTHDENS